MTEKVTDLRGTPVNVGDTIVYGATDGRSAGLRIGTVIGIVWAHQKPFYSGSEYMRDVPTKLKVQVERNSGYGKIEKATLIEAGFKRFVKLG